MGGSKTGTYLSDLKQIAKISGQDYAVVLGEMMSQTQQSIAQLHLAAPVVPKPEKNDSKPPQVEPTARSVYNDPSVPVFPPSQPTLTTSDVTSISANALGAVKTSLSADDLYPLVLQRYVVEHVVQSSDSSLHVSHRGGVGEELYAKFMDTFQNHGEKPSEYLQRLHVALQHAVRRGVPEKDIHNRLLAQFCRGCWDNVLISELQLKQRKTNPPSFVEFLLLLRTEEDREAAKSLRMKQHIEARQKVGTHSQLVLPENEKNLCTVLTNLTKQLSQQMTTIQQQLATLTAIQTGHMPASQTRHSPVTSDAAKRPKTRKPAKSTRPVSVNLKPGFCFRCGEDRHICPQCDARPNSTLVSAKHKQFQDKQQEWRNQNSTSRKHLN